MNSKEIKAAKTLLEVVRQAQPQFLLSDEKLIIIPPGSQQVEVAIAQRQVISEDTVVRR